MAQLTLSFGDAEAPPATAAAPAAPPPPTELAPLPPAPPTPTYSARPADLEDADRERWAVLQAEAAWAALGRSRRLAVYAAELGLAVVYAERRLLAAGLTAAAARGLLGPQVMVPALEGADPWPLVAALTAAHAPAAGAETGAT